MSLRDLLPGYVARNLPHGVRFFATNVALLGFVAWFFVDHSLSGVVSAAPVVLALALVSSVLFWPFRFDELGPPSPDYYLRYRHANRLEVSILKGSHLENWDGMFDLESLRSLRIDSVDRFGDMVNLVFDGKVVHNVQLVSWPGIPERMARELCDALLLRCARRESLTGGSS